MMERQVNHMVRLVDDLLEVSRITRGKIELRKEPLDVESLVRNAVETSQPAIGAGGHRLVLDLPAKPLSIDGDPVRLAQVLANLLNNAAKYTDAGGEIRVRVRRCDDTVEIGVRDTGIGIGPEMLPRVFDLFTQAQRHEGRAQGGLGIGLTLVKRLLEMHGGSVHAESAGAGLGSEFFVRLPLRPADSPAATPRAAQAAAQLSRRVLVVDDNRDAAESLGMVLKLLGADVQVVFNGPDALEAVQSYKPAAVLLDLGMPGMDGEEVARRMRQRPECDSVTLVALTGWGQQDDRRRTLAAGFDYHLIKPADVNALSALLATIVSGEGSARHMRS
jgi:CheY-like chemotaxis protein